MNTTKEAAAALSISRRWVLAGSAAVVVIRTIRIVLPRTPGDLGTRNAIRN